MNRTEKRRQQKLAIKAATKSPNQRSNASHQTLSLAMQHHSAGRLSEAEGIYQQILQADPNQPVALHLLGVIAHQVGKNDIAVDLITKALAINPNFAEAHNNLGLALQAMGKFEDALTSYEKAIAIKPDYAEAHNNLGLTLQAMGKFEDAVASYQHTITINPDLVEVYSNLGLTLQDMGKFEEAIASYHMALAIKPDYVEVHFQLGVTLKDLGRHEEAVASYHKALAIKPDYADPLFNLGITFKELGKLDEAFECHRRAVALNPQNDLFWDGLAGILEAFSFTSIDDHLWQDLLHLLERPTVRPTYLVRPVISALRHHPNFSQFIKLTGSRKPGISIAYGDAAEQLSTIPLFLRIMGLSTIYDLEVERMLTLLRHALIKETVAGKMDEKGLLFSVALALQCFTNEFVFPESDEEKALVEKLEQQISTLVKKNRNVPPLFVAALGSYRPLYMFSWAQKLAVREWASNIKEVIERQISEPFIELSLRPQIPHLTPIQGTVSQSVREQYEDNPYPRWIKTGLAAEGRSIGAALQGAPFHFDIGEYVSPKRPEILVAGCGTGQHALVTASKFSNAQVLAVDLSLSSLSYALRKTNELGLSNIEYAQADIMELGKLGRQFDLIECVGVLHHLGDPLAGWQILVDLLKSGGFMKIGLYSEIARQCVVEGRSMISEKGYATSAKGIRQCRQDIIEMAEDGNREMEKIISRGDFFSLSECRDLLFHVQEHRFTLPQIDTALKSLKLKFLGFEMRDKSALRKFTKKTRPRKGALTSLPLWHTFERKNPDTFIGMYQFWCKKI